MTLETGHLKTAQVIPPSEPGGIADIYRDKPASYFANTRTDFVERLETGPDSSVLELGCGAGGTGRAVLAAGKAGRYVGLELDPGAAEIARDGLSEVIIGDVQAADLTSLEGQFDALVISEVVEHLADPWTTVERLARCVRPGGQLLASSPNIAHWKIILELLNGRFEYKEAGMMDRTHLRWFTPDSYQALFEEAGFRIETISSMRAAGWRGRLFNRLTGDRYRHLFMGQVVVMGRKL